MGKTKPQIPAVIEIGRDLKKEIIKNVYFLFGEDSYSLDLTSDLIEAKVKKYIATDFDREVVYGENITSGDIYNSATSFPFGSEKKLIIVKEFEKVKDRKTLHSLLKSPPDFLVLLLIHNGPVSGFENEFYRTLLEKGFIYEAKELKGKYLVSWLIDFVESKGKQLSEDNARLMIDISGENRSLLEMQAEKIVTFVGEEKEINHKSILSLTARLKEHNIFDLQNAIGRRNKAEANRIAINMLEKGAEPVYLIFMLVRYFTGLTRINELDQSNTNVFAAARIVGTHNFYYSDYQTARSRFREEDLMRAARALLKADESIKTTGIDGKTAVTLLINEILE